jgi:hypothetical protein
VYFLQKQKKERKTNNNNTKIVPITTNNQKKQINKNIYIYIYLNACQLGPEAKVAMG